MKNETLREAKAELRRWFESQPAAYLTSVVDECRAGTFAYSSRCHCLRGLCDGGYSGATATTFQAAKAESALLLLKWDSIEDFKKHIDVNTVVSRENITRARTLPIVLAEIRRRERAIEAQLEPAEAAVRG